MPRQAVPPEDVGLPVARDSRPGRGSPSPGRPPSARAAPPCSSPRPSATATRRPRARVPPQDVALPVARSGRTRWRPNRKPPASVASVASGLVTTTSAGPAACAPAVATIVSVFTTVIPVAGTPPIVTVAPCRKYAPVIVTGVPPVVRATGGSMTLTPIAPPKPYVAMGVGDGPCASRGRAVRSHHCPSTAGPLRSSTRRCAKSPAAIAVAAPNGPPTAVGVTRVVVVPSPSWP